MFVCRSEMQYNTCISENRLQNYCKRYPILLSRGDMHVQDIPGTVENCSNELPGYTLINGFSGSEEMSRINCCQAEKTVTPGIARYDRYLYEPLEQLLF